MKIEVNGLRRSAAFIFGASIFEAAEGDGMNICRSC
jgi:hypothetical protein